MGVDYSIPPHEQAPGTLSDASNVIPNDSGLVTGRNGQVKLNAESLGGRVTSVFEHRDGASTRNILASYGTKIGLYSSATGEFSDVITGLTDDQMTQWVNFGGKAICVNGADTPQYFTDSSTCGDLAGTPPTGLTIASWGNRVWLGGDTTYPAKLTGCVLNNPTDWTTTGSATSIITNTIGDANDPITGLVGFFDWLIIGKKNNLYKLTGDPVTDATSIAIAPVFSENPDNIGFTSQWAITQIGRDIVFQDGYDIKALSSIESYGDVETTSIIPHFRDYLKSIVDQKYLQYTQFFHYKQKKQLWVSIPTGASTHFVFVLDYQFKDATERYSFFPMSGLTIASFGGVENGEVADMYYGDETGYVRHLGIGDNDDGDAITRSFVQTISGNDPTQGEMTFHERRKSFNHIEAFLRPRKTPLL